MRDNITHQPITSNIIVYRQRLYNTTHTALLPRNTVFRRTMDVSVVVGSPHVVSIIFLTPILINIFLTPHFKYILVTFSKTVILEFFFRNLVFSSDLDSLSKKNCQF